MNVRSMTGFGQGTAEGSGFNIRVELRSVNNRFADLRCRLPAEIAAWEGEIKRRVLQRVQRGRVELTVKVENAGGGDSAPSFNHDFYDEVRSSAERLKAEHGLVGELTLADVLAIPGMFRVDASSPAWGDEERRVLDTALDEALDALEADRGREGANLQAELVERVGEMERLTGEVKRLAATVPEKVRARLLDRLRALAADVEMDPARVAQEAVLLADRADVTEELVRLSGHLEQARALLEEPDGKPVGRRLEFLLQEIHRETNTINSKSQALDMSRVALELKTACEKFREQVQNVE